MAEKTTPEPKAAIAGSCVHYTNTGHAQRVFTPGKQWSDEAEEEFLDCLAASCNVSWSAGQAGVAHTTVYRHRRLRAEFASRWQAALEQGYARLEMGLIEAANDSLAGVKFDEKRPIPPMTYDQIIRILGAHAASVKGGDRKKPGWQAQPKPLEEMRESIIRKVEAIKNARGKIAPANTAPAKTAPVKTAPVKKPRAKTPRAKITPDQSTAQAAD